MTCRKNRIAVLMTVHNRRDKTLLCLRNLYMQKLPKDTSFDVFLTNDGCTDGTPDAIREEFPTVNIIEGDGNLFWNRGMYRAWEEASRCYDYDFYLWLNDDTLLFEDVLLSMIQEAKENPDSVIVGSTHSTSDPKLITYGGLLNGRKLHPNGLLQRCETFNGNIVLIPKSIFKLIGNLDYTYVHSIGDVDYGWMVTRAKKAIFVSCNYRGVCDSNSQKRKWMRPEIPLKERWKNYHSPLGYSPPKEFFHFNRKNFGLVKAVLIWTSNHMRLFFPSLWTK